MSKGKEKEEKGKEEEERRKREGGRVEEKGRKKREGERGEEAGRRKEEGERGKVEEGGEEDGKEEIHFINEANPQLATDVTFSLFNSNSMLRSAILGFSIFFLCISKPAYENVFLKATPLTSNESWKDMMEHILEYILQWNIYPFYYESQTKTVARRLHLYTNQPTTHERLTKLKQSLFPLDHNKNYLKRTAGDFLDADHV